MLYPVFRKDRTQQPSWTQNVDKTLTWITNLISSISGKNTVYDSTKDRSKDSPHKASSAIRKETVGLTVGLKQLSSWYCLYHMFDALSDFISKLARADCKLENMEQHACA